MTIKHATFTIERTYPAPIDKVWQAWSTPEKARWFVGPDDWESSDHALDFRPGGTEHVSGTDPKSGTVHRYDAVYQDIKTNERIVSTYTMHANDTRTSVSVATIEFTDDNGQTTVTCTEQGAFFDELDRPEWREQGTNDLLDALGRSL